MAEIKRTENGGSQNDLLSSRSSSRASLVAIIAPPSIAPKKRSWRGGEEVGGGGAASAANERQTTSAVQPPSRRSFKSLNSTYVRCRRGTALSAAPPPAGGARTLAKIGGHRHLTHTSGVGAKEAASDGGDAAT